MTGQIQAMTNLMTMLGASGATIAARTARMAADPNAIAGDPETLRMVTEKMAAIGEAGAAALAATPGFMMAWQRWWWSRATAFHAGAVETADRRLVTDLSKAMEQLAAASQTPFRRRAVANARRFSR